MTSTGKLQACDACWQIKMQCSLVLGGARQQKWKAGDNSEDGVQPKRMQVVVEVLGPSQGMRPAPTL